MSKKVLFVDDETGKIEEAATFTLVPNRQKTPKIETFTLNSTHITQKKINLSSLPDNPANVVLIPDGGPVQLNGIDYMVDGAVISWESLGLDNFLEPNDILFINYIKEG